MSTTTPPATAIQPPETQSTAQKQEETLRLLAEVNLLHARQAKARAEREARFYERYPVFARHDWLLPASVGVGAICAGVVLGGALFALAKFIVA